MFAASLLVIAVMATYASLAVISLSGVSSFTGSALPGNLLKGLVSSAVGWHPPGVKQVVHAKSPTTGGGAPLADITLFDFGALPTESTRQISVTNSSSTVLPLHVSVVGASGVTARFASNNLSTFNVHPRHAATVNLTSVPLYAGPINGRLEISIVGSDAQVYSIQLTGAQAPIASPSLTATPAANGAVDLAWAPSPSSGVSGYVVQRSTGATGNWQTVATLPASATSAVDQTPTDATYAYQVIAEAQGTSTSGPMMSPPGPQATAAAVATPPAKPVDVGSPEFINKAMAANGGGVNISVDLAPDSSPTDTITVTLTDSNGKSITGQTSGGSSPVTVNVPNVGTLADGTITVSATAADSLGNTSKPFTGGPSIWKDVIVPAQASVSIQPITGPGAADSVPVTVVTEPAAQGGATVAVQITDGVTATPPVKDNENFGDTSITIPVDANSIPDGGEVYATATVTDEAGNPSSTGTSQPVTKDTTGPELPESIGVLAGPNNPAGVVTAASESAVTVQAAFDAPPSQDTQMVIWVAGTAYPVTPDGQSTTLTLPPIDMSGLADGTYKIGIKETDAFGNVSKSWTWHFVKDTGGAEAPTSVGVPAGPENPAGYVNAATQTAATIVATFAGPTDPADQISLTVGGMPLPAQSGGSDQISWTADLSNLPDGTLPISGTIVDPNGVTSTFSGSLIKDTQAPPAPAVAYVVGPPPNTIKPSDAACVKVLVAFNQAPDPNDVVNVTLSDGSTSAQGSASAGDGHVLVGCIDASSLSAGSISVAVTVTDAAGNSTDMTGTPATLLNCTPSQGGGQGQSQDQ